MVLQVQVQVVVVVGWNDQRSVPGWEGEGKGEGGRKEGEYQCHIQL
jgi:hypothetical protein